MSDQQTGLEHEMGRDSFASDEEYKRHALRHSTAHIMAEAIGVVFPGTSYAIGPAIEDGFYYDVDVDRPITEEDLTSIQKAMKKIVKRNSKFERCEISRDEALKMFTDTGQKYKVEIIQGLPEDTVISLYDHGGFTDLCAGPHVQRTGNCKH